MKPARCAASAAAELSTGIRSVDQIWQPLMFAPIPRDTALSRSSVTTTALPFASCPVTILLTCSVMRTPGIRGQSPISFLRTRKQDRALTQNPPLVARPVQAHPADCHRDRGLRGLDHRDADLVLQRFPIARHAGAAHDDHVRGVLVAQRLAHLDHAPEGFLLIR